MSELNHLYNAEKIICADLHMGMGNKVLKVCPSIQWSLVRLSVEKFPLTRFKPGSGVLCYRFANCAIVLYCKRWYYLKVAKLFETLVWLN